MKTTTSMNEFQQDCLRAASMNARLQALLTFNQQIRETHQTYWRVLSAGKSSEIPADPGISERVIKAYDQHAHKPISAVDEQLAYTLSVLHTAMVVQMDGLVAASMTLHSRGTKLPPFQEDHRLKKRADELLRDTLGTAVQFLGQHLLDQSNLMLNDERS